MDQAQFDDKAMEIFVFLFRKPIQFFVSLIKQWDLGGNFYMYLKKRGLKKSYLGLIIFRYLKLLFLFLFFNNLEDKVDVMGMVMIGKNN